MVLKSCIRKKLAVVTCIGLPKCITVTLCIHVDPMHVCRQYIVVTALDSCLGYYTRNAFPAKKFTVIPSLAAKKISQVKATGLNVAALTSTNELYIWGRTGRYSSTSIPQLICWDIGIIAFSMSHGGAAIITTDGSFFISQETEIVPIEMTEEQYSKYKHVDRIAGGYNSCIAYTTPAKMQRTQHFCDIVINNL